MAHKGKIYPVAQLWRVYSGNVDSTSGLVPEVVRFRTQFWVFASGSAPMGVIKDCERLPWTGGDNEIGFQSAPFSAGSLTVQVGAIGKLADNHRMLWKLAVWDSGTDQIPWGMNDQQDHYAWHPGYSQIWFTNPGSGPTILPNGVTELWGKRWDEF